MLQLTQTIAGAPHLRRSQVAHQRIPRRTADALADPIYEARHKHLGHERGDRLPQEDIATE